MNVPHQDRVALFIPTLEGGGAERMMVNLLNGLVQAGISVDLVLCRAQGPFLAEVPSTVRVFDLQAGRKLWLAIPALARYLHRERPRAMISRMIHPNLMALMARALAQVNTRLVVIEACHFSQSLSTGQVKGRIRALARWLYPRADEIVAVSRGVARDLESSLGLPEGQVHVIYNPVVNNELSVCASAPSGHPWLDDHGIPTLISVGRLAAQKDHATLLRAFALLRKRRAVRLIIFGEGEQRAHLENLRRELCLEKDVDLPGFAVNPYAAMARASLFVLSSAFEGLPNALIEALACGCPVVSTDCPSGPAEILEEGRYGLLVPPGDYRALASAIEDALDCEWDRDVLIKRGSEFSRDAALTQYLESIGYSLPTNLRSAAA